MNNCILGIGINGLSFSIYRLSIYDDQANYDYICNVMSEKNINGNGSFLISFVDKNMIQGLPIGYWKIKGGGIRFNWGESLSWFTMIDANGHETKTIKAASDKGSVSGFSTEDLTKAIFPKAQSIISEFPSAEIYNAIINVKNSMPHIDDIKKNRELINPEECVEYFTNKTFEKLSNYVNHFRLAKALLQKSEDNRSKLLLTKMTDDFMNLICNI